MNVFPKMIPINISMPFMLWSWKWVINQRHATFEIKTILNHATLQLQLFADMERRRQQLETRDQEERKRKRETEIEEEERQKAETEWQKNFEESRQNRVTSWQDFQSGSSSKKKSKKEKKKNMHSFNPPKLKPETRWENVWALFCWVLRTLWD